MSNKSGGAFEFRSIDVTGAYVEHFMPRIFDPLALVLLESARFSRGEHMLDVACGPGTVARMAAELVGPFGRVTATDISEEMLAVAQNLPGPKNPSVPVEYVASGIEALPFEDGEFDLVICQQGLQFFPDKHAALLEMRRVLKSTGRVALAVWAQIDQCPYFEAMYHALKETVPLELAEMITVPFSFPFPNALTFQMKEAGFCDVHVETVSRPLIFEEGVDHAIEAMNATPLAPKLKALEPERHAAFMEAARRYLKPLIWDDRVETMMVSNIAVGHCPNSPVKPQGT
ncbi:MAG: methyltransferase domain-containing protein [Candidatus Eremiobacteraeota bacterium]|nr:methyltransferase domain-containing protein [Candidatus Eremiobacteraeota bacterium]